MGRSKRSGELTTDVKLSIADHILGGLAEEIKDLGIRSVFEASLTDDDGGPEIPAYVEVYSHNEKTGFVRRGNIYCKSDRLTYHEACGTHQMAGGVTEFELADPKSIEQVLAHVKARVHHWEELGRIFASDLDGEPEPAPDDFLKRYALKAV